MERPKASSDVEQQGICSLSQHGQGASNRQHIMLDTIDPPNRRQGRHDVSLALDILSFDYIEGRPQHNVE
ncbi:hypothetical protein CCHR01_14437 [Colletotrichum chrysophilum]|uniref:Uncharacterized protein n=1 Tax=Colletotrichum chrysophilum TaxID=1836956 RepID=A0AAD9EC99_9PEZI|nr:hypothetical protein CCHR01_14437 [Colletotrichum chrysophilum]